MEKDKSALEYCKRHVSTIYDWIYERAYKDEIDKMYSRRLNADRDRKINMLEIKIDELQVKLSELTSHSGENKTESGGNGSFTETLADKC